MHNQCLRFEVVYTFNDGTTEIKVFDHKHKFVSYVLGLKPYEVTEQNVAHAIALDLKNRINQAELALEVAERYLTEVLRLRHT